METTFLWFVEHMISTAVFCHIFRQSVVVHKKQVQKKLDNIQRIAQRFCRACWKFVIEAMTVLARTQRRFSKKQALKIRIRKCVFVLSWLRNTNYKPKELIRVVIFEHVSMKYEWIRSHGQSLAWFRFLQTIVALISFFKRYGNPKQMSVNIARELGHLGGVHYKVHIVKVHSLDYS